MNRTAEDWNDRSGEFDPVEADAELASIVLPSGPDEDGGFDAIAEYMDRETAYVEAAPPRGGPDQ